MLNTFFKSGWQSDSAEKRIQSIDKMNPLSEDSQRILETLAEQDKDTHVRKAALEKLANPALVFQISQSHHDEATRDHATSALSVLVGAKSELTEAEFRQLIANHPELTESVAQYCPHSDLRNEIIQRLSEPEQAALIARVEYSETRQAIAQQLTSTKDLELARKLVRGKDKNAEKIIKGKLDVLHAQQRQEHENRQTADAICEKMEYLATHDWRAEFKTQYSIWSQRWEALAFTPDSETQKRYTVNSEKVAEDVARETAIEDALFSQKTTARELEAYCHTISSLNTTQLIEQKSTTAKKLEQAQIKWRISCDTITSDETIAAQFATAQQALTELDRFCDLLHVETDLDNQKRSNESLQSSLAALNWPAQYPALTAQSEVEAALAELVADRQKAQKEATENLDKLHKRINRLLGATSRGDLAMAKRELTAVTKAAARYSGKDQAALTERLEKAERAVSKMGDWKDFATEPKYLELCDAMESLHGSKAHPDKLAAKINELQRAWKALGHSDSADKHWDRFKAAADLAYEPCSEFFKQRRDNRKRNLQKREPLVQQMQALLENTDWDASPDYKQIESELRSIHNAWQKIKDVEPGAGKKQWDRLSKFKTSIYQKLDIVYDANIELKNELITQSTTLLESDLTEDALNKLQFIQKKWKQVGVTRRKQDQAAWKKFKRVTDDVFNKIQNLRQAKRDDQDAQLQGYRQIINDIQNLAKTANNLADADSRFDQLQAAYKELPSLPKDLPDKLVERLASDLQRADDTYSRARDRIIKAQHQEGLNALAKKAALCTQLEQLDSNATEEEKQRLKDSIKEIQITNRDLAKRFEERLAAALDSNRQQANDTRKRICIELEILLGVESPKEDTAQRMQIQLERMKKDGIGQAQTQKDATLDNLKLDWLCLPGADPDIQQALDKRFSQLIAKGK